MKAASRPITRTVGEAWEYHVTVHDRMSEEVLNQLGAVGWELVGVVPDGNPASATFYFKRPALSFKERVTLEQKHRYYREWGREIPENERGGRQMH
jgi:hypothetical protein